MEWKHIYIYGNVICYLLAGGGQASVFNQLDSNNIQNALPVPNHTLPAMSVHTLLIIFNAGVCNALAGGRQAAGRADCERRETAPEPARA